MDKKQVSHDLALASAKAMSETYKDLDPKTIIVNMAYDYYAAYGYYMSLSDEIIKEWSQKTL